MFVAETFIELPIVCAHTFGSGSGSASLVIDGVKITPEVAESKGWNTSIHNNGFLAWVLVEVPISALVKARKVAWHKAAYPGGKDSYKGSGRGLIRYALRHVLQEQRADALEQAARSADPLGVGVRAFSSDLQERCAQIKHRIWMRREAETRALHIQNLERAARQSPKARQVLKDFLNAWPEYKPGTHRLIQQARYAPSV